MDGKFAFARRRTGFEGFKQQDETRPYSKIIKEEWVRGDRIVETIIL